MKDKLMNIYKEYCCDGQYIHARLILRFMIDKQLLLGLSDIDWDIQCKLENIGLKYNVIRSGNGARFRY